MFHVYCEFSGAEVHTPSWLDADATFRSYCRQWPSREVVLDRLGGEFLGQNEFGVPEYETREQIMVRPRAEAA